MKEKLSAILTLGVIFSLFFYYKVINPVENDIVISSLDSNDKPIIAKVVENNDINLIDEIAIEKNNDPCSMDLNETDEMDFSSAFKYYRDCNGSDSTFSWNNNLYSTILISEVNSDDNLKKQLDNDRNLVVDKKHLNLQNHIIGDNSNIE